MVGSRYWAQNCPSEDPEASPLLPCTAQSSVTSDTSSSSDDEFPSISVKHRPTSDDSASTSDESAAPPPSLSWAQWRRLLFLCAINLLNGCCIAVQLPFFPYEASRRGLSSTASGAVFSCFALSQALAYPVMGWLAPRLGVTRLYVLGLLLAGLATVVFGLLARIEEAAPFLAASLAVRAAEAAGSAGALTAGRTLLINRFPRHVNTAMSVAGAMTGAGLCLGPALGGAVYTLAGYGAPFYTLGALLLATGAASLLMPDVTDNTTDKTGSDTDSGDDTDDDGDTDGGDRSYDHMMRLVLSTPDNWLIFAALLVIAINWTALDPDMEPYVNHTLGIDPAELGLFFLCTSVFYAFSSPAWGRLSDAVDNTFLLVAVCLALNGLGVMLIPPSPLLGLEPSRLLFGLGLGISDVFQAGANLPLLALMVRCSAARGLRSDDVRGQALVSAVYGAVFSLGEGLGPVGGGLVTDWFGYPALATGMGAVTAAVSLAMAVRGLVYHATSTRGAVK